VFLSSNLRPPDCKAPDVAPNFYPAAIGVWPSVVPGWAVMAAVRGAEPSMERGAADRRATALDGWAHPAESRVGPLVVIIGTPGFEHGTGMRERTE
jgi:hypothetical protein